ncbi:MAG: flagellar basal-body MS-ring/collar protein FliF [Erysipelotrichaceae bacterium]
MDQQLNATWTKIKEYWQSQSKKTQKLIIGVAIGVLCLSIITPVALRYQSEQNVSVLYKGLSTNESAEIYNKLQEMSIPASMNAAGEILVPTSELNYVKMQLSTLGYPKTGLSYDVFTSNAGFMATELEKKQYLIMDLQNRLQETIRQIESVSAAIVTLNIPENSNYIWDTNNKTGSASVMLTLTSGNRLSSELVTGIQNLVASSVPQMDSESVTIVDAATGTQLQNTQKEPTGMDENFLQIEFESQVEQKIQEKILNLLSLPYGLENIRVSATVVIDYDKMLEEQLEYIPNENGEGVIEKLEEWYLNDGTLSGGIAGEDSNTDTPTYPDGEGGDETTGEYSRSAEYLVSYIKRQIEKNNAVLKSSSISVVINGKDLSQNDIDNWVTTIAKAVNVEEEDVVVNAVNEPTETILPPTQLLEDYLPWIVLGIGAFFILLLVIVISSMLASKRKRKRMAQLAQLEEATTTLNQMEPKTIMEAQADHKDPLKATLESIQDFAAVNPDMAANLIREMLKEED